MKRKKKVHTGEGGSGPLVWHRGPVLLSEISRLLRHAPDSVWAFPRRVDALGWININFYTIVPLYLRSRSSKTLATIDSPKRENLVGFRPKVALSGSLAAKVAQSWRRGVKKTLWGKQVRSHFWLGLWSTTFAHFFVDGPNTVCSAPISSFTISLFVLL